MTKLKDLKYEAQGIETPRPALQILEAVSIGLVIAVVVFSVVVILI